MRQLLIFAISFSLNATLLWGDSDTLLAKAKSGDPAAQYDLAVEQMFGKDVTDNGIERPPRYGEAAKWLTKAAKAGDPRAQYLLGSLYERGRGVRKNASAAMRLYKEAMKGGYKEAACPLARLYEQSDIHPKDPEITRPCYMQ